MLTIGIDVAVLASIGLACMLMVTIACVAAKVTQEQGIVAIAASAFTVFVMVIGYIIMARVLDALTF